MSTSIEKNTKSPATTPDCKEWFLYRPRTRSAKKKLLFSAPIVISSDSEGSDVECAHNSYVTQIVAKEEIISEQADVTVDVATNRSDSSATMETETLVDSHLVENQRDLQIGTSDGSKNDQTSDTVVYVVDVSKQKMFSIECSVNNDNSEPIEIAAINDTIEVANETIGQLEYESSNESDDTIDWIVNGGPSNKEKSTSFDSSVNHHIVTGEAVETNKKADAIEDSANEMNHDNVRTQNYLAVVPYQTLLNTSVPNDSAAVSKLNSGHLSDVESDDSFGLVIDEHYESNSVSADNATLHKSDNESLRELENVVETDDDPVMIINEVDEIDSINLDDPLSIPNDDKNLTEDCMEIAVQPSDTTNIFKAETKSLHKRSVSVSDDEIATSGVKCEDESEPVTSSSLRIENIRSYDTELWKTTEVIVDEAVEVS